MSDTTVIPAKAAKPTAPAAPAAAPLSNLSTRRQQSLRSAQIKQFVPSALNSMGEGDHDLLAVVVPAEWTFADVLNPAAWARLAARLAKDATGMQRSKDYIGSTAKLYHPKFHAEVVITGLVRDQFGGACGVNVVCIGPAQDKTGLGCPRNLETGLPWVDPVVAE
jgi:hypothetical protein